MYSARKAAFGEKGMINQGSSTDSDSVGPGSNPGSPAIEFTNILGLPRWPVLAIWEPVWENRSRFILNRASTSHHVHGVRGRAPSGISARFPTFDPLHPPHGLKGLGRKLEMGVAS